MIVVGVDPGARSTGLAVIDTTRNAGMIATPFLAASITVERTDDRPLLEVPAEYLLRVNAAVVDAVREFAGELVAVERVRRPSWHVARGSKSGRGGAAADPSAIMATGIVFGAIAGRAWTVPLVAIPPDGNGRVLPLDRYPVPLATTGKGNDKRRHERAAYDVATAGPQVARFAAATGGGIYS